MLQLGLGLGLGPGNVFFPSFFFSLLKVTKVFVLRVTVRDVKMMYSQERMCPF